jgi:hypothetical protein
VNVSVHLRAVVIAGALAALALALGFVTLAMNQTASQASPHQVLSLKARHLASGKTTAVVKRVKPVDPNFKAALAAGLPRPVARALASSPVAVVQLTSASDPVAKLAAGEAQSGARLAGASYVAVNVDRDGGPVEQLTRVLGSLPVAPASIVYARPATVSITLTGFNDRTVVQQAVANAAVTAGGVASASAAPAPDWASRAGALCRQANEEIGALGGLGAPGKLAAHQVKFEAVASGFLAQFAALDAAAGKAAAVKQLNAVLRRAFAAQDARVAAAARHDAVAGRVAAAKARPLFTQAGKLESALGASGCVETSA